MTRLLPEVVPALLVRDLDETLRFYGRIGFRVTGRWPDDAPRWAEVTRDGVRLWFHLDPPVGTPPEPVMSGTIYLRPDSVEALAAELRGVVPFAWGPEVMPYGLRELAVQDPNGYYVAFAEPA